MCSLKFFYQIKSSLIITFILILFLKKVLSQREENDFEPLISAKCERSLMIINVVTKEPFYGVIHTRDYRRRNSCLVYGSGSFNTTLRISAVASEDDEKYCGVHQHKTNEEDRSVAIAVRFHRELELSQDKYYSITCSQSFFVNSKNSRSRLSMKFIGDQGQDASRRLIHGNSYKLKIDIDNPDYVYGMFIRNCIGFSAVNTTEVELIDEYGCPVDDSIIEPFEYSNSTNSISTKIKSMFKFPESNRVYIQCNALLCKNGCDFKPDCTESLYKKSFISKPIRPDSNVLSLLTSTTVFVVDPGEDILDSIKLNEECDIWKFPWLITLLICLASLLLIMLIVNIFLCTSLTCTCTKTEVVEKEDASELEDYDPYKIDWSANNHKTPVQASTYSSRTSLARHAINDGNESDFRPNSRFSSSQTGKKTSNHSYANYR